MRRHRSWPAWRRRGRRLRPTRTRPPYDIGGVAPHVGRNGVLSDPQSLRYDCNGDVAYGNAPGDEPAASSSTSARLGYAHSFRNGLLSAQVYRQVQNGVVLPTLVNGTVLNASLPPDYFTTVEQVFQSAGGCDAGPDVPFGAQNVYFSVPIGGVQRIYEGAQVAATFNFGNLNVQPYYNITVAKANSSDPRINNPYSIVIPGAQLPNTPLHKAGLTLDYKAPHSIVEGLVSAQYVGANNSQNLPAYTVIDAGIDLHLAHGDLTIAGNNLFNTYGGIFATNVGAVPYTTLGGEQIATIARPNSPRQFTVTYTVPFGASAAAANNGSSLVAAGAGERRRSRWPGRGSSAGVRADRCGSNALCSRRCRPARPAIRLRWRRRTPLARPTARKRCSRSWIRSKPYVAKIEAAKTRSGYPDAVPGAPQIPGVNVSYHKVGSSYALALKCSGANRICKHCRHASPCTSRNPKTCKAADSTSRRARCSSAPRSSSCPQSASTSRVRCSSRDNRASGSINCRRALRRRRSS